MKNIRLPRWEELHKFPIVNFYYADYRGNLCVEVRSIIRLIEVYQIDSPHVLEKLKQKEQKGELFLSRQDYEELVLICEEEEDNIPPKK